MKKSRLLWLLPLVFLLAPTAQDQYGAAAWRLLKKFRYDTTGGFFFDADGDGVRGADGTEPYYDKQIIEVPADYASIQAALDSNDCKKGTTTTPQGCHIRFAGTRAEKFEISDASTTGNEQRSIIIEGTGSGGYMAGGYNLCAATLTGDGSADHKIISIDESHHVILRNFCINMNNGTANEAKYAIAIGSNGSTNTSAKNVVMENLSIYGEGAANGAAILFGNQGGSNSDTAFNLARNVNIEGVRTCIEINAQQAIDNRLESVQCANPTATIGGINMEEGQAHSVGFYMTPGAANQIGIYVGADSIGGTIRDCNFEWDQNTGTMIQFDDTSDGAYRAHLIQGCRFQPQVISTLKCVDWSRQGTLNIHSNSFESGTSSSRVCTFDFNNPSATKDSDILFTGNDIQWDGTQSDPSVTRTSDGGALRLAVIDDGEFFKCTGTVVGSHDLIPTATGCSAP